MGASVCVCVCVCCIGLGMHEQAEVCEHFVTPPFPSCVVALRATGFMLGIFFSPAHHHHLRRSWLRPAAPRGLQVYQAIADSPPINSSIAANQIAQPRPTLPPLLSLPLNRATFCFGFFFFFMTADCCCFSISWPFLPYNQFAQHAHYL